jgi:hypothetical protein
MRALQEAQNWKSLSADMEVVLTSGNFQAAADKLQEMERSLIVLKVSSFLLFFFFVFVFFFLSKSDSHPNSRVSLNMRPTETSY